MGDNFEPMLDNSKVQSSQQMATQVYAYIIYI